MSEMQSYLVWDLSLSSEVLNICIIGVHHNKFCQVPWGTQCSEGTSPVNSAADFGNCTNQKNNNMQNDVMRITCTNIWIAFWQKKFCTMKPENQDLLSIHIIILTSSLSGIALRACCSCYSLITSQTIYPECTSTATTRWSLFLMRHKYPMLSNWF